MSLIKASMTVGWYTLLSRLVGFARDMIIASKLGAGPMADAFFVAFKLPNLFRRLFAEGAFNSAFVPLFAGKLATEGKDSARAFAEQVLMALLTILVILTAIMHFTMPWIMVVMAPGFMDKPETFNLAISLARITFPYLLFISLVSLLSGVLQSLGRFAVAAAAPILLNLAMIGTLLYLTSYTQTPAHALSIGVFIGGVLQLLWLAAATARAGFWLYARKPTWCKDTRLFLKRMVPGIIGGGVTQINIWIDTLIATLVTGAVSYLYYADRITQLPLAIIGTAVGTALLPSLSRTFKEGNTEKAVMIQNRAIEFTLFLTLPAAVAAAVINQPIMSVLFERGEFSHEDVIQSARALAGYALGLPAFVLVKVLTPGFFANGDTKTPVKIGMICLVTNTTVALLLLPYLAHVGIALATATSSWVNVTLLTRGLTKRGYFRLDERSYQRLPRIILCSVFMGVVLYGITLLLAVLTLHKIIGLAILVLGGMLAYFGGAFAIKAVTLQDLREILSRKKKA
jgi:putative peptidoglycan lipid II flippase